MATCTTPFIMLSTQTYCDVLPGHTLCFLCVHVMVRVLEIDMENVRLRPPLNKKVFAVYRPGELKRADWNFFFSYFFTLPPCTF